MKYLSIFSPVSREAIRKFVEKRNLPEHLKEIKARPQEDFLIASDTPPVFVVSDGVTLDIKKLLEKNTEYPDPSPAGEVARIFCEAVIKRAKEIYETTEENDIVEIFKYANGEVRKYNEDVGESDISGNPTGYYSATGSFTIVKDNKAYWASICDSFIAHFDANMNLKFMTSGLCQPYAVINGEERMTEHLEKGVLNLEEGDRLFVFTDGFEYYMQNPDFLELFKKWDANLNENIDKFSQNANIKDPEKYGHERSLIAILF